jgi:periplasmic protein CpxP/Spy
MRLIPTSLVLTAVAAAAAFALPLIKPAVEAQRTEKITEITAPASLPQVRKGGLLKRLNLTRDQLRQVAKARRTYQPSIQAHARNVRTLQSELKRLMAGSAEPGEVRAKFQQLQAQRQELQQLRFESSLAIRQILTPAQRQKFEAALSQRQAK